ncbi:hypothetical protein ACLNGM_09825 [Aureimonas phyllosphaerae]|uniref:hypothetical protein n=1 Tax=Aureimonas phyllosphaerae TaxID=1166078 RepID=UPI003A5BA528
MNRSLQDRWNRLTVTFSKAELDFVSENYRLSRKAMFDAFQHRFHRVDVSTWALVTLRQQHGWLRWGRRAGNAEGSPRPIRTWEYVDRDGYVRIRATERVDGKRTSRSNMKHRLLWEGVHGPIPDGMVLRALGPVGNPDPSNWTLVSSDVSCRLSRMNVKAFNTLPEELQVAMLALAQIKSTLRGSRMKGRKRT